MFDNDISKFLDLAKNLIGEKDFNYRINKCKEYYIDFYNNQRYKYNIRNATACFYTYDVMAWYLYQMSLYTNEPQNSDLNLCSRIIPQFKTIGMNIHKLDEIKNCKVKLKQILRSKDNSVDNKISEIIIAIKYVNTGFSNVELIEESDEKTPDLLVCKNNRKLYVESKRRIKNYNYYLLERKHWSRLSSPVFDFLRSKFSNKYFRIIFHKELMEYSDDFLLNIISSIYDSNSVGLVIENNEISVSMHNSNIQETKNYLEKNYLRADTTQFFNMMFNYDFELDKGITYGAYAKYDKNPFYLSELDYGYALIWKCDSKEAIKNHSKSLKKRLSEAVEQINLNEIGSIHFTVESYEGNIVDFETFNKLNFDIKSFDFKNRNIQYIYLHFLKFRIPPNDNWLVDQDCIFWGNINADENLLIENPHLLG